MATTVFAIKGKLGSTEYYVITMKAGEVVSNIRVPNKVDGWDDLDIEQLYQREINDARVKNLIAPYLARDKDRFFGSLLVTMQNSDGVIFEPLTDVATKLPVAYKTPASGAGFLTLTGGEILFPIDGQHRLRAIQYAIDGKDSSGKDLPDFEASSELAQEDVVIILFKFNTETSRKIFTKVNKYAKPTTKAQNLITDDDDVAAVITRKVANEVIGARMVNFKNNTLTNNSVEFTTLATLYECVGSILDAMHGKIDRTTRPDREKEKLYIKNAEEKFETLVENIDHFKTILTHIDESGDDRRKELRTQILPAKPIVQLCIVKAFLEIKYGIKTKDGRKATDAEIFAGLNSIDWSMENKNWQKILMNGQKIMAGRGTINLATNFIIYFSGFMPKDKELELLEQYKNCFTDEEQLKINTLPNLADKT